MVNEIGNLRRNLQANGYAGGFIFSWTRLFLPGVALVLIKRKRLLVLCISHMLRTFIKRSDL
jgi:hypothetical protein